eukprot:2720055-Rhodomonas_salina.1
MLARDAGRKMQERGKRLKQKAVDAGLLATGFGGGDGDGLEGGVGHEPGGEKTWTRWASAGQRGGRSGSECPWQARGSCAGASGRASEARRWEQTRTAAC